MDGNVGDSLQAAHLHEFVGQEPHGPAGVPLGRIGASQQGQLRFDVADDLGRLSRARLLGKSSLEPFGEKPAPVAQPGPLLSTPVNLVEPHEEPAGLDPGVVIASDEPAPRHELHALLGDPAPAQRSGLLLKPLEWFNAPFNSLPDAVRDVAGQVAIVTLVNALAVLLYIVLFRR